LEKVDSVNTQAAIFKKFFANLPEPLLPFSFYDRFLDADGMWLALVVMALNVQFF